MKEYSNNIKIVLTILKDEVYGDTSSALQKMSDDYKMTWVYQTEGGELFPVSKKDFKAELADIYQTKERKYDIKNITENEDVVMVELIESYPDGDAANIYRTPLVLVLELENGKIKRGRHYCDPKLSFLHLSEKKIDSIFE